MICPGVKTCTLICVCKLTYKTSVYDLSHEAVGFVCSSVEIIKIQVCYHFIFNRHVASFLKRGGGGLNPKYLDNFKNWDILQIMQILIRGGGSIPCKHLSVEFIILLSFSFSKKAGGGWATPWYFNFQYINLRKLSATKKKWDRGMLPTARPPRSRCYVHVQEQGWYWIIGKPKVDQGFFSTTKILHYF